MASDSKYHLDRVVFRRVCIAEGKSAADVGRAVTAAMHHNVWSRFYYKDIPYGEQIFHIIGKVLNREGACFMVIDPIDDDPSSAAHRFAQRVEELIHRDLLPSTYFDHETQEERPVDLPHYLLQMGDPVLSNLSITYRQQLDAFEILKHWDILEEFPIETRYRQPGLVGPMKIVPPEKGLLLEGLKSRERIEVDALNYIERHPRLHLNKTQYRYASRLKKFLELGPEAKPAGANFTVDESQTIDADWDCRRAFIISGADELALYGHYRPTRFAINTTKRMLLLEEQDCNRRLWAVWWRDLFYVNREELIAIGNALGTPGETPNFDELRDLVRKNVARARRQIEDLHQRYPQEFRREEESDDQPRRWKRAPGKLQGSPLRSHLCHRSSTR